MKPVAPVMKQLMILADDAGGSGYEGTLDADMRSSP